MRAEIQEENLGYEIDDNAEIEDENLENEIENNNEIEDENVEDSINDVANEEEQQNMSLDKEMDAKYGTRRSGNERTMTQTTSGL
jgi:hypothetical protein